MSGTCLSSTIALYTDNPSLGSTLAETFSPLLPGGAKCVNGESLSSMTARLGVQVSDSMSSDLASHITELLADGNLDPAAYAQSEQGAEMAKLAGTMQTELNACTGSAPGSNRKMMSSPFPFDLTVYFQLTGKAIIAVGAGFQGLLNAGIYASTTGQTGFHIAPCAGVTAGGGLFGAGTSVGIVLGDQNDFTNTRWATDIDIPFPVSPTLQAGIIPELNSMEMHPFLELGISTGADFSPLAINVCTAFLFPFDVNFVA